MHPLRALFQWLLLTQPAMGLPRPPTQLARPLKTIILIRHAEGLHNVDDAYLQKPDPPLTDNGVRQCLDLRRHLEPKLKNMGRDIKAVYVSPSFRTLQTAFYSLGWKLHNKRTDPPVIADARLQELYGHDLCNHGRPVAELIEEFPWVDYTQPIQSNFPERDNCGGELAYNVKAIEARTQGVLAAIDAREEEVIAVVGHSGHFKKVLGNRDFDNADYRMYTLMRDEGYYRLQMWEGYENGGLGKPRSGGNDVPYMRDVPVTKK